MGFYRPLGPTVAPSPIAGRKRSNRVEPYLDQKFQDAVQLICSGRASILKAAKICGIPKSTLYMRLKEIGISSTMVNQQNWSDAKSFKLFILLTFYLFILIL